MVSNVNSRLMKGKTSDDSALFGHLSVASSQLEDNQQTESNFGGAAAKNSTQQNKRAHTKNSNQHDESGEMMGFDRRQLNQVHSDSEQDEDDDDSEDSDQGPKRWAETNSLEMDCVFLEEEDTNGHKQESHLPQIFDPELVVQLESKTCMLCSELFGKIRLVF